MPFHEAVYLASTDKVYAVMENYIVKCNSSTGLMEATAKICAPCYGPMRISGAASTLYVASHNDYSLNTWFNLRSSNKQIWNVDATTLGVTNFCLLDETLQANLWAGNSIPYNYFSWGPTCMVVSGGYMYFVDTQDGGGMQMMRVNLTNQADNDYTTFNGPQHPYQNPEIFYINGLDTFHADANQLEVEHWTIDNALPNPWVVDAGSDCAPEYPVATVYVPSVGKAYSVAGTESLWRHDAYPGVATQLLLGPVSANVAPMRLRLSPLDGKLYIPCQNQDVVIVWDTATETGIEKTGFDSPVDIVFTGTKSWAVQTGINGLKEII